MPDGETLDRLRHIREVVRETAGAMPLQEDYLRNIGCDLTPLRRVR